MRTEAVWHACADVDLAGGPERAAGRRSARRSRRIVVIFGASGDLTKRKLLPALFHLEQAGLLPQQFAVVGVARRPLGDELRQGHAARGSSKFGGVNEGDAEAG